MNFFMLNCGLTSVCPEFERSLAREAEAACVFRDIKRCAKHVLVDAIGISVARLMLERQLADWTSKRHGKSCRAPSAIAFPHRDSRRSGSRRSSRRARAG